MPISGYPDLKALVQAGFFHLILAVIIGFGVTSRPLHAAGLLRLKTMLPVAPHCLSARRRRNEQARGGADQSDTDDSRAGDRLQRRERHLEARDQRDHARAALSQSARAR